MPRVRCNLLMAKPFAPALPAGMACALSESGDQTESREVARPPPPLFAHYPYINEGGTPMKRSLWYLPLLSLALLALARPSAAGDHGLGWDYKTLPGAACQPVSAADAADLLRSPVGIVNNGARGERSVLCPIVRDTVNEYDLDIGVTVTRGVTCQFYIMNYQGHYAAGTPYSPSSTSPVDTGIDIHYFLIKANPQTDPLGFVGYYTLACSLPSGGAVLSYSSGEFAVTTDYGE